MLAWRHDTHVGMETWHGDTTMDTWHYRKRSSLMENSGIAHLTLFCTNAALWVSTKEKLHFIIFIIFNYIQKNTPVFHDADILRNTRGRYDRLNRLYSDE